MMRRLTLAVTFTLLLPGYVLCDEWSVKGNVNQSIAYDDNVFMTPDRACAQGDEFSCPQDSFKYVINPLLTMQHRTDNTDVSAHASYGTQIYTDIEGFDQDFQSYGLNGLYKTEKIDWGLNWNYAITPTRNTAVQTSNIFNNNSSQNSWSVSPQATIRIDDIDSLIITPSYSETTFDKVPGSQNNNFFNDNQSYNINLAWQRLWSERYVSGLSFFYNKFDSQVQRNATDTNGRILRDNRGRIIVENTPSTFDNFGINLSNTYLLSDNWKVAAILGGRYTETEIGNLSDTSFGFLADARADYTGENYSAGLYFNRGLLPSSFGQLQEQTSVGLNFTYNIWETLSTNLNFNYQESTIVNSRFNNILRNSIGNRTNFVIEPSVSWRFAEDWTLGGSYRYRFQDIQDGTGTIFNGEADSNLFMISINYNWQGVSISK